MGNVTTKPQSYKKLISRLRDLQRAGKSTLFERVELCVTVFRDSEFRADHSELDDSACGDLLKDDFLQEMVGTEFVHLVTMYERFPNKQEWEARKFSNMLDIVKGEEEDRRRAIREETGLQVHRERVTREQLKLAEQAKKEVEARAKYLERETEAQKSEVEKLREENVRLKQELAEERGRRMELEKMLGQKVAAA